MNVYDTTPSLSGKAGQAYGFTVTDAGLGAYSCIAGIFGDALAVNKLFNPLDMAGKI